MHLTDVFLLLSVAFCLLLIETTVEKERTPGSPLVKSENEPANADSSNKLMNTADTETQSTCDTNDEKTATESDSGVSVDTQSDITKDSCDDIDTQKDITKETETDSGVSVTDSSVSAVDRSENVQNLPETTVIHDRTSEQSSKAIDTATHNLTKDEFFEDHLISPVSPISPHSPQFECSYEEDYMPGGKLYLKSPKCFDTQTTAVILLKFKRKCTYVQK